MTKSDINKILIEILNEYCETQDIDLKINVNTALMGNDSILDSMGLVNVIIDIESKFLDLDMDITLTSEQAMSRRNSPFRNIETLSEYILEQVENNNE